jgi:hypothetical protein
MDPESTKKERQKPRYDLALAMVRALLATAFRTGDS